MSDIYQKCFELLQSSSDGLLCEEMSEYLDQPITSQQMSALRRKGLAYPWGRKRNRDGRKAQLWKANV